MRSLKVIEMAYSVCADSLGDKPLSVYTAQDFDLRTQRSVLEKVVRQYADYSANEDLVRDWCVDYAAKKDRTSNIIAGTWRWCLKINKELPVRMQKQR